MLDKCLYIINKEYKSISDYKIINKGTNSLVIKLVHSDSQYSILKIYPNFSEDKRNRLQNELNFLKFLQANNIKNIPTVYYSNPNSNFTILSWIEGSKLHSSENINLEEIANFIYLINDSKLKKLDLIQYASEANFNIEQTIKLINQIAQNKLNELKKYSEKNDFYNWFNNFLIKDIYLTFEEVEDNFLTENYNYEDKKIISQSDVGFHNILLENKCKNLFFIDFEYAGWDNPMKFISDWILQPDSFFPEQKPLEFFQPLVNSVILDPNWKSNIKPYLLLYRLRWCLIISNKIFRLGDENKSAKKEIILKLKKYSEDSKNYIQTLYN